MSSGTSEWRSKSAEILAQNQLGDIQNRAVKAYVNAMKQLKVLPR